MSPPLSIAMPTRNRPELLERAIGSVLEAAGPVASQVEVAVSDGSTNEASGEVVHRLLADWPGGYRYVWNRPALDLPGNMNRATGLAIGTWILQLHDDDLLRPGAGQAVLDAIGRAGPAERVLLFGVDVVGLDGSVRRTQHFRRERYLPPKAALERVLRNSSFVRLPAAVVHRAAFAEEGGFEGALGATCDTDMWMRLFSRYGVRCLPQTTCAYTVHEAATTTGMWNRETVRANLRDVRPRGRPRDRAGARHPALGDRLLPPVHPWRRLSAPAAARARRGARGPAAVRAARAARPRGLAEVAAGAGRVRGRHRRDTPARVTYFPGERR